MDADAHIEVVVPVVSLNLARQPLRLFQDPESRAHGARRIVFVRFDGTKDGQQAVPRILEDATLVRLDD
jgi:hypothetical protein